MSTQTGCLRLCYVLLSVLRALRSFSAQRRHFINYDFISVHLSHSNLVILVNFTVPNLHTHTHTKKKQQRNIRLLKQSAGCSGKNDHDTTPFRPFACFCF